MLSEVQAELDTRTKRLKAGVNASCVVAQRSSVFISTADSLTDSQLSGKALERAREERAERRAQLQIRQTQRDEILARKKKARQAKKQELTQMSRPFSTPASATVLSPLPKLVAEVRSLSDFCDQDKKKSDLTREGVEDSDLTKAIEQAKRDAEAVVEEEEQNGAIEQAMRAEASKQIGVGVIPPSKLQGSTQDEMHKRGDQEGKVEQEEGGEEYVVGKLAELLQQAEISQEEYDDAVADLRIKPAEQQQQQQQQKQQHQEHQQQEEHHCDQVSQQQHPCARVVVARPYRHSPTHPTFASGRD
jgi:hypothetical protein